MQQDILMTSMKIDIQSLLHQFLVGTERPKIGQSLKYNALIIMD
jgi:hypothetical protein